MRTEKPPPTKRPLSNNSYKFSSKKNQAQVPNICDQSITFTFISKTNEEKFYYFTSRIYAVFKQIVLPSQSSRPVFSNIISTSHHPFLALHRETRSLSLRWPLSSPPDSHHCSLLPFGTSMLHFPLPRTAPRPPLTVISLLSV